jgi:hypothetical protein
LSWEKTFIDIASREKQIELDMLYNSWQLTWVRIASYSEPQSSRMMTYSSTIRQSSSSEISTSSSKISMASGMANSDTESS